MREKDQLKKQKIAQAVYEIAERDGLAGLSLSKIAKWAGVSSGTPYVYYHDKTDMLSQLYISTKHQLEAGLSERLEQAQTTKEKLIMGLEYFAHQYLHSPSKANYIMAINSAPELVNATARDEIMSITTAMGKLYLELDSASQIKITDDPVEVSALLLGPVMWLLHQAKIKHLQISDQQIHNVVLIAVNGLLPD